MSLRDLAGRLSISHSHLSRSLRGAQGKTIRWQLAGDIAVALRLPRGYFPEYRAGRVAEYLMQHPKAATALFDELKLK